MSMRYRSLLFRGLAACAAMAVSVALLQGCAAGAAGAGRSAEARTEASRSDLVTPSDETQSRRRARIRIELATTYLQNEQPTVALDEVKQALTADPGYAPAYSLRGIIYMRLNDFALSEESFRRAIAIEPRDADSMQNLAWLMCQQKRYDEADRTFSQAASQPGYANLSKTLMTQGICQDRAGRAADAEATLARAYELDAGNPTTAFRLAELMVRRGDYARARFYIRRVNNGEYASAESLWLGMRVERRMGDSVALAQLGDQLRKRYPQSTQAASYERGAFDE